MTIDKQSLKSSSVEERVIKQNMSQTYYNKHKDVIDRVIFLTKREMNKRIDELEEDICDSDLGWGYSRKQIKSLKGYCSRCIAQTNGSNVCKCGEKE